MIKLLVKEVILYDDKVEIYYNYIDNPQKEGVVKRNNPFATIIN